MIKRPLNPQFRTAVLEDRKVTTIREKPWPVGVPIMLYHWQGKAYRSPQVDIVVIEVLETMTVEIHQPEFAELVFTPRQIEGRPIWSCEGFRDQDEMDSWFLPHLKPGRTITRALMRFRRHPVYLGMPDPLKK